MLRWFVLLTGIVFSAAIAQAAVFGGSDRPGLSPMALSLTLLLSSIVFVLLFVKSNPNSSDFVRWMDENSSLILGPGALFNGKHITRDTEVRIFLLTVSVIFMTSKMPSRPYLAKETECRVGQAAHTVGSLVLGWWGIPWGPIYTVQAVVRNLEGGTSSTVGAYLAHVTKRRVVSKASPIILFTKGLGAALFGLPFRSSEYFGTSGRQYFAMGSLHKRHAGWSIGCSVDMDIWKSLGEVT